MSESRDRLERAEAELVELAHVISHDLRAPLRAIESFGGLLATECAGLEGDSAEYLGFVVDGARRIKDMIDGIMALLRLEGARDEPVDVALSEVAAEVASGFADTIADRRGSLTVGELPVVRARRRQMRRLLHELVDNAIKFSSDAPVIEISGRAEPDRWVLDVSDSGIGMAPAHAGRIFLLFNRLHTAQEYPGVGLGLALCRKIAETHGGAISVESAPGAGARFTVVLPRAS